MTSTTRLETILLDILETARLAPSVHNTQPWRVELSGPDSLRITIDPAHRLEDGDPTGRQTIISLGIFAETIAIAAASHGLKLAETNLFDNGATLQFAHSTVNDNPRLVQLLKSRCTDRSIYKPILVEAGTIKRIEAARLSPSVSTKVVTDKKLIYEIAELTSKGIGVALSSPGFRKELSGYLTLPWSSKSRGIAVRSLYIPWYLEVIEPLLMRLGIGLRAEVSLEKRRWLSASGVVIILADGDVPKYWFDLGRSYLQVSLSIEAEGLSQATSAAIVEASNYHEDIENALGTEQRILALIRIGKGESRRHYSPRLQAKELLT